MKSTTYARIALAFGMVAGVLVMTPADAAYERPPRALLCEEGDKMVDTFPYEMQLEEAMAYDEGPRSCTYREALPITFWCAGFPDEAPTSTMLNVISNSTSKRRLTPVLCDGTVHTGTVEEMYPAFPGPYHVHWHLRDGDWNEAYLRVG